MLKNAFLYVTRKKLKSLVIFFVVLIMAALGMISLAIQDATSKVAKEAFSGVTNSFSMEINRQVNQGTPRGGGNVKGMDIKKISESPEIEYTVKRINSVADLVGKDIIETPETLRGRSAERAKNFKRAVMLTGVNDSARETKFVSGAYKLVSGEHLKNDDKNQILMHEDLAKKNNLKVGDKIKIKSNLFDADNEKAANETVEVKIKGLFAGKNTGGVTAAQELYENTLVTDVSTAAKVYGNDEDTAVYQDATFFVKGEKNLDQVMAAVKKLDVNWREYNLIKSASNYPALEQSISGMYGVANQMFFGSLIFAGMVVALVLLLWMNARKKEIAILLAIGLEKGQIFGQFVIELLMVSLPAFVGAYVLAGKFAKIMGNDILKNVTIGVTKQMAKQAGATQLGGGAEMEGFTKTLSAIDVQMTTNAVVITVIFMLVIILVSLGVISYRNLKKNPKELLTEL